MIKLLYITLCILLTTASAVGQEGQIMTVSGSIPSSEMDVSLIHEHVLVDFIGAEETGHHRWKHEEVIPVVLPYLKEIRELGVRTMIECTPAFIGRDPVLLKTLSDSSGIQLITNTGYYGASDNKFLPSHAFKETADQLAARWQKDWEKGINGTGIKPGFIKIGVNSGELSDLHQKLIIAAARLHRKSGLTIASHTGPALPAFQQIALLKEEGVAPEAFVWVHAQSEKDPGKHLEAAQKGAWISLDGLNKDNVTEYLKMINNLRKHGFLHKVLLSQDAGWYSPGEKEGGDFRGYSTIFTQFLPLLREEGYEDKEIRQLLVQNPRNAFEIKIRRID